MRGRIIQIVSTANQARLDFGTIFAECFRKIAITTTMHVLNDNLGACDVVLMLHELHQRGYEQLRLHCGWSPNGLAWRWQIYPKCLMGNDAYWEKHSDCTPFDCPCGSTAYPRCGDYKQAADEFLSSESEILELGKLPDKEYIRWYAQLVEHAQRDMFPVAFSEYFPSDDSWLYYPRDEKLAYPPFTPTDLDAVSDEWMFAYGKLALDEYSRSELNTLYNFDGIVPPIHEVADVIRQCIKEHKLFSSHMDLAVEQVMLYDSKDIAERRDEGSKIYLKLNDGKEVELIDTTEICAMPPYRMKYCRYYRGTEPTMDDGFDEYYFAKAEQFFVEEEHSDREKSAVNSIYLSKLYDLQSDEVPIELLGFLFSVCDHILQRGSWKGVSLKQVARHFRTMFFPKYLSAPIIGMR